MSTAVIARPDQSEYMSYYGKYVSLVPEGNIVEKRLNGSWTKLLLYSAEDF